MNIIITGSLGRIGKPLTKLLIRNGHRVTVISGKAEKLGAISELGATAAIGNLQDKAFLADTFQAADAVYAMVPPANYFDPHLNLMEYVTGIADSYKNAISQTGVPRVVYLSSIGADLTNGSGIILPYHYAEGIINSLPAEVNITVIRPTAIYYNLYSFIRDIKNTGAINSNYGGNDLISWVSPLDIADTVATELERPDAFGRTMRYIASDELTCNETAAILGQSIGLPDLKWNTVPSGPIQANLEAAGMQPEIASGYLAMNDSMHHGTFFEDYRRNRPEAMGRIKMRDFAEDFAKAYQQS
jgi:uncharacterized protein YbjT (DUF2867 family)